MKKYLLAIVIFFSIMLVLFSWYDENLFTSTASAQIPFIVVLMDTSASMNDVVFYPYDGVNDSTPGAGYDLYKTGGYTGTISVTNFDAGESGVPTSVETSISDSRYFGFKVINTSTTQTIASADFSGQVLANGSSSIQISKTTYDQYASPANYWVVGKTSGAYAKVSGKSSKTVSHTTTYYYDINSKGGTFPDNSSTFIANETLYVYTTLATNQVLKRAYFYGYPTGSGEGGYVRYNLDYLKWLLLYATNSGETAPYGQLQQTSYFHKYGTFDTSVVSPNRPTDLDSNCMCSATGAIKRVPITRIQAGREAMCNVANANWGKIVLGIFKFSADSLGGEKVENLNNSSSPNVVLKSIYGSTPAGGNTPLAAALADVWAYFRPQGGQQPTYWPTGWGTDGVKHSNYSPSVSTAGFGPPGLKANKCTHFYTIAVTDGQSSSDKFTAAKYNNAIFKSTVSPIKRTGTATTNWDYKKGWGDYDSHDPTTPSGTQNTFSDYCVGTGSCWTSNGNDYLDDVAYLLYNSDMLPDELYPTWPGDQNIVTHVVGFNMVNDMLKETAHNGGGDFYTASSYEELSDALQSAINKIILREEQMMYNVFAAPKQAVTAKTELFGFKGTFMPKNDMTIWQGHLKCYQLTSSGDFPDDSQFKWDAANKLIATTVAERKIYTYKSANAKTDLTDTDNAFTTANITPADLDVSSTGARDGVVNFIRGTNSYGFKLGDIFHFNPVVVGSPLQWKGQFNPSYQAFYEANKTRQEVVYIGTNDGMLHCIRVQSGGVVTAGGTELWGFVPPSHLNRVKNLVEKSVLDLLSKVPPNCDPAPCTYEFDRYFVDGKAMVKDVQINDTWKTVLIFGMGIGGRSYCALDVTNPEVPKFLWEFTDTYMGYTEARPIITDINDGTATYPAVIIPGGYDYWEKPAVTGDLTTWTGKGLYVLKVAPGAGFTPQLVKKFIFTGNGTAGESVVGGVAVRRINDFVYPFVAAPALFDKNRDSISDYIYAVDTGNYRAGQAGGRIWKIPISGAPATWIPEIIFKTPLTQTLFLSPTLGYDLDWNLWVFFGTGRRSQITANTSFPCVADPLTTCYNFTNTSGQFYAFMDEPIKKSFTYPLNMTDSSHLARMKNITTFFTSTPTDAQKMIDSDMVGVYFNYFRGGSEVIFEPTPIFIDNTLVMNTYLPEVATATTTETDCGTSGGFAGKNSVYKFTLGRIGGSSAITGTDVFGGKILGSGVLSSGKYIIYFGPETVGTYTVTGRDIPPLEDIFGTVLWKEDKK